jgi:hypothetical protein
VTDIPRVAPDTTEYNLAPIHQTLRQDGVVTIAYVMGHEMYQPGHENTFLLMLRGNLRNREEITEFVMDADGWGAQITDATGIRYHVRIGRERQDFIDAFGAAEVVMYQGHSRYGRGPAFAGFTDYFRMGSSSNDLEIDALLPSFRTEALRQPATYPPRYVDIGAERYVYQYRGGHDETSHLDDESYTKLIAGGARDFLDADFLTGTQVFWLYSCTNQQYWQQTFRRRFANRSQKFVFGTVDESFWGLAPSVIFVIAMVTGETSSNAIISSLNATGDCENCFTAW